MAADGGAIYWAEFCGNRSDYNIFWSEAFTIYTQSPDLTNCFQKIVLTWVTCGYLWLAAIPYSLFLRTQATIHPLGSISRQNLLHMIVISLLAAVSLSDLFYLLTLRNDGNLATEPYPADYTDVCVQVTTYVLAGVLCHWGFRKGEHSPGTLFVFWLLQLAIGIVTFRSKILQWQDQGVIYSLFTFVTFYVRFGLIVVQFLMSLFADLDAIRPTTRGHAREESHELLVDITQEVWEARHKPCPEIMSSFPSKIFFGWFFPKVYKGYCQTLSDEDMWDIRPGDSSGAIVPHFEEAWQVEMEKAGVKKSSQKPTSVETPIDKEKKTKYGTLNDSTFTDNTAPKQPAGDESKGPDGKKKRPSLMMAMLRTFGWYYLPMGLLLLGMDVMTLINPLLLKQLIDYVERGGGDYPWHGYFLTVAMFIISVVKVLFFCHHFYAGYITGLWSRTALISAIYRKAMRLSNAARKHKTVGDIVNLMSVDTEKIVQIWLGLHFLWSAPLTIFAAMYFQYQILGPACLSGLVVLLIFIPINTAILARKIRKLQKEQMALKDKRIKLMNQVLNGIKVLKLYAWEPHFCDEILKIRTQELHKLRQTSLLSAATTSLWILAPFLVSVRSNPHLFNLKFQEILSAVALLDFITYTFTSEKRLDPQTAFTMLSLIYAQNFQFNMIPQAILWIVNALVSIRRIEHFFMAEEINPDNVKPDYMQDDVISIEDGTFSWGEKDRITLTDISLSVSRGALVGIVGQVGAGKSSIIGAILGEMEKLQGEVVVNGSIAYVPQQAWIQNLTLRDNVLFSRPLHDNRYQDVLKACALEPDLETLPGGDLTEIGEQGINLSGGQKQRVSLARAVYHDADIYLMDDPLSAVDAHVGKHIFKEVMGPDGILKHKTRLLVTHGISHLSKMDLVVVIKDGRISEMGKYDDLINTQGAFSEFINTYLTENIEDISDPEERQELEKLQHLRTLSSPVDGSTADPLSSKADGSTADPLSSKADGSTTGGSRGSDKDLEGSSKCSLRSHSTKAKSEVTSKSDMSKEAERKALDKQIADQHKLIVEEKSAVGSISSDVLKAYTKAASYKYVILAVIGLVIYTGALVGTNIWLSEWTNDALLNDTYQDVPTSMLRLGVYGAFGIFSIGSIFALMVVIVLGSVAASYHMHQAVLSKILRCPMSFFDTTPLGRILNRFSKDVDIMDTNIQQYILNLFLMGGPLLTIIIVITYTTPFFIIVVIPLAVLFGFLQRFYVCCSRQIKRIDSVKKSPIYAFFSETLNGTSVIRAYEAQSRFITHSDSLLDDSQRVWFEVFSSNRWVNVYAELMGDLIVLFTGLFAVLQRDNINPSLVGLSLTFALQISINLTYMVRYMCDLETYIVSVERIQEYADLEPEAPWLLEKRPPRTWPSEGAVVFSNYETRFREGMDLVLRDVTCHIRPAEMVGIIGRTGAGKSSMTLGLFRILEAARGSIKIDDLDITEMGLHDLRNKLTIIPQDPVLFSGSLRFNLDPAESHTDQEIWVSLQQAHLRAFVDTLPETLMYECGENGENLSVGQRQLVCLARALLRKTKILVLDEATAAVDMGTDDLIQSTIRSEFKGCTVITIAHRLNTILDYDRVIVMADGRIEEFDTPTSLRENKASLFYSMAKDAGIV